MLKMGTFSCTAHVQHTELFLQGTYQMDVYSFSAAVLQMIFSIHYFSIFIFLDSFNHMSHIFTSWKFYSMISIDMEYFCTILH